ncbi:MAG: hypothetical protein ACTS5G_00600 [Burkholderiales bacterium]
MKLPLYAAGCAALMLLAPKVFAHAGHGTPGTIGHDLQHHLWTFIALVVVGALLMSGEHCVALLRARKRDARRKDES